MDVIAQPIGQIRLGDWLNSNLQGDWAGFRAAVAFVKKSGVRYIETALTGFAQSKSVEIIAGVDHQGTSYEGLKALLDAVSPNSRVVIFHNRLPHTFHPKIYLFTSTKKAEVFVGSGNLTAGGLYTNYEIGLRIPLDLNEEAQQGVLDNIEAVLDIWSDESSVTTLILDHARLEVLVKAGLVPKESEMSPGAQSSKSLPPHSGQEHVEIPFGTLAVPPPPKASPPPQGTPVPVSGGEGAQGVAEQRFVMTLQKTDVGVGQTTEGTARRSPEIFVPLKARNANPEFWDWRDGFDEDPERPGKFDRTGVRMRMGGKVVKVNMMTWPVKHDFRLRSEALRSIGEIGDILLMEKVVGEVFEYDVSAISTTAPNYETMRTKCDQNVQNSEKRFGYY